MFNDWEAKNCAPDKRAAIYFKGGETEALKRLSSYLFDTKNILTYKQTRNGMVGNAYSSKLSAWLSLGCISPRLIYTEIKKFEKQFEANESTYWLIFELIWRDYFYFLMNKFGTKFFKLNGIKNKPVANKNHDSNLFETWKNGHTGNDFIDANMIELKLTGFMSNRGRQNVASYLCHDLKLDWRMGATYFEHQLIDYDVCSNWGNWAYLAGVGNDPRPNRKFNIDKQANDYDADKTFRNLWLK
jgi:deoxyribodipyrimidine photo-lyase